VLRLRLLQLLLLLRLLRMRVRTLGIHAASVSFFSSSLVVVRWTRCAVQSVILQSLFDRDAEAKDKTIDLVSAMVGKMIHARCRRPRLAVRAASWLPSLPSIQLVGAHRGALVGHRAQQLREMRATQRGPCTMTPNSLDNCCLFSCCVWVPEQLRACFGWEWEGISALATDSQRPRRWAAPHAPHTTQHEGQDTATLEHGADRVKATVTSKGAWWGQSLLLSFFWGAALTHALDSHTTHRQGTHTAFHSNRTVRLHGCAGVTLPLPLSPLAPCVCVPSGSPQSIRESEASPCSLTWQSEFVSVWRLSNKGVGQGIEAGS
jgi:hypothetical protein